MSILSQMVDVKNQKEPTWPEKIEVVFFESPN
jgi:hypothetical protein